MLNGIDLDQMVSMQWHAKHQWGGGVLPNLDREATVFGDITRTLHPSLKMVRLQNQLSTGSEVVWLLCQPHLQMLNHHWDKGKSTLPLVFTIVVTLPSFIVSSARKRTLSVWP